jgi:hypothetical protein
MSEQMLELSDEQAAEFGFAPAITETTTPVTAEITKNATAVESEPVTTPPATEKHTESAAPKDDTQPVTHGGKPLYTPEEVAQILKEEATTGKVLLDSSRLTPEGKLLQKSFQQGYGPKFEQAKQMREEAIRIKTEIEQAKKDAENQRLFQKETDEHGEDEAQRRLIERQRDERIARLEWENQQAREQSATMQIRNDYRQSAPKYFVPQDQEFEDIILSSIVAGDLLKIEGAPKTIDESVALISNKLGFTNIDNLWKIIRANPANEVAIKNFYINSYNKEKAKGLTISPSSSATVHTPPAKNVPNKDAITNILERFGVKDLDEINLT